MEECSKEDGSWRTHAVAETFAAAAYRNVLAEFRGRGKYSRAPHRTADNCLKTRGKIIAS